MKTRIFLPLVLISCFISGKAFTQESGQKQEKTEKHEKHDGHEKAEKKNNMSSWPELKSFHSVMAQTFHPSEEGNLKPIRERSSEMHAKAVTLRDSKKPAEFDTPEIKAATVELVEKSKALDDLVKKNGSDEEVTALLSSAHDTFHKIVGLCKKDDHHGHDHGHDGHDHPQPAKDKDQK